MTATAKSEKNNPKPHVVMVCVSTSHGNTRRVAGEMAEILGARVVEPETLELSDLEDVDLIGFGSGIYGFDFHPRLKQLIAPLRVTTPKAAFVYSTSGAPQPFLWRYTDRLADRLRAQGFDVIDTFSCRGWDTWLPLRLIGGINKNRPNDADLADARAFATRLLEQTIESMRDRDGTELPSA